MRGSPKKVKKGSKAWTQKARRSRKKRKRKPNIKRL
jgi:hypothetical protein